MTLTCYYFGCLNFLPPTSHMHQEQAIMNNFSLIIFALKENECYGDRECEHSWIPNCQWTKSAMSPNGAGTSWLGFGAVPARQETCACPLKPKWGSGQQDPHVDETPLVNTLHSFEPEDLEIWSGQKCSEWEVPCQISHGPVKRGCSEGCSGTGLGQLVSRVSE